MTQLVENPVETKRATWAIDPSHVSVEFAVKHLMIATVKGRFGSVQATVQGAPDDPLSAVAEAEISVASIDTGNADRDTHLRSADFFDADRYPTIRYVSRSVRRLDDDEFEVQGDLTIREISRPVTLRARFEGLITDPWGNERVGLSAEGKIKRSDFGLEWNMALEAGGVVVGDDVRLSIQVEAVRQAA
jgi:polyisoprenoid-binding protein YceI